MYNQPHAMFHKQQGKQKELSVKTLHFPSFFFNVSLNSGDIACRVVGGTELRVFPGH